MESKLKCKIMRKVKLTIEHTQGNYFRIEKNVSVKSGKSAKETLKKAELDWLNQYINRDVYIRQFSNVTEAKKRAGVSIKSEFVDD